jgi:hypothetical protein
MGVVVIGADTHRRLPEIAVWGVGVARAARSAAKPHRSTEREERGEENQSEGACHARSRVSGAVAPSCNISSRKACT